LQTENCSQIRARNEDKSINQKNEIWKINLSANSRMFEGKRPRNRKVEKKQTNLQKNKRKHRIMEKSEKGSGTSALRFSQSKVILGEHQNVIREGWIAI
jgi:hypothetical protein